MNTFTKNAKTYKAEDAELTNRLFNGGYQDADAGDEYIVEYAASATDDNGLDVEIIWQFNDVKGRERAAEDYDWDNEDCMTINAQERTYTDNELHTSTEHVSAIARWRFNPATQEVLEYDKSQKAYVYFGTYHQIGLTAKMNEAKKIEAVEAYQDHMDLVNNS